MKPKFLVVDLFCGFGGTTTGFEMTNGLAKVIACVNHDPKAIKSHWMNYQSVKHFEEDIRTLNLTSLLKLVEKYKIKYPDAKLILWASLECTNFSKAKGGQPRDADSRTLAEHLNRYVDTLNPDYIMIENVVEFMSWGPLDENGKPICRKNGEDWLRWCKSICAFGYYDEWRELNSANYGAYTSRNRLFGCFAKYDLEIHWPVSTHAKNPENGLFEHREKWKAVKDVLDFNDEGESIFTRKIKEFMALYGLLDIKMRMLRVKELLKIQGFPDDYKMDGTQADQKKFIGNSVVPHVVMAWCKAMANGNKTLKLKTA